jgi:hypothetical protein
MPEKKIEIVLTKQHRAKICEDMIVEFMNLIQELDISYSKPNFTIKDYTLEQFFKRNAKIMDNKFKRNKKKVLYIYK